MSKVVQQSIVATNRQGRNIRRLMDSLAMELGIIKQEDWYGVSTAQINEKLGSKKLTFGFLRSLSKAYPEFEWHKRQSVSKQWNDPLNQKKYLNINNTSLSKALSSASDYKSHRKHLDWVANRLGITVFEDWYSLSIRKLANNGGRRLLSEHGNSLHRVLQNIYSEFTWYPFLFEKTPQNFWYEMKHHRDYLDWLSSVLQIRDQSGWYELSFATVKENHGGGIILLYDGSVAKMVTSIYKEMKWYPWLFVHSNMNWWDDLNTHKEYFNWLEAQLGIQQDSQWTCVTLEQVRRAGGGKLLEQHYNNSLMNALVHLYPHRFDHIPRLGWIEIKRQRTFFDWLAIQLDIRTLDDWYRVTHEMISANGGRHALKPYNESVYAALKSVYPEHNWYPWRFKKSPWHTWNDMDNQRNCMNWIGEQLGVRHPQGWLSVTREAVCNVGGRGLLNRHGGSLFKALSTIFPEEFSWRFLQTSSEGQWAMKSTLESLGMQLVYNYKHPQLVRANGSRMELDLYIPSLQLAFEYQGEQHYMQSSLANLNNSLFNKKRRDEEKRMACKSLGITLVEVPFWWNRSPFNLMHFIHQQPHMSMNSIRLY